MTCTRGDVLAVATSYPAITLTVNVAANAPAAVANFAQVSGGGEQNLVNDKVQDATNINQVTAMKVTAVAGTPQCANVGSAFATNLQVIAKTEPSNPVSGVTVTFTAPTGAAPSGNCPGPSNIGTVVNNGSGVATAPTFT